MDQARSSYAVAASYRPSSLSLPAEPFVVSEEPRLAPLPLVRRAAAAAGERAAAAAAAALAAGLFASAEREAGAAELAFG